MSDYMEGCPDCEKMSKEMSRTILENDLARAYFFDRYREGQTLVYVKRHIISMSAMTAEEQVAVFDLITRVSKALEEKYNARKTYLLMIGDGSKWQHLHFHLIPKHRDLPSMGLYCFQKLWEAEPQRETPDSERESVAAELREMIESS